MKLTYEEFMTWHAGDLDGLWLRIEADREAIREETRAEVLKDHFAQGEPIIMHRIGHSAIHGFVDICVVGPMPPMSHSSTTLERPSARAAKITAILHHFKTDREFDWSKITDEQLDGMIAIGRIEVGS